MRRQHELAKEHDFTFLRTAAQVREFARKERLEHLTGNADYTMGRVSFPYARPSVRLFIEQLAAQYRAATGEQLVVTSLTRPIANQPRNASPLSVHPAGMAVDLRVPRSSSARRWLERKLLSLERDGLIDATRERRPPHYHVAVFPDAYEAYAAEIAGSIPVNPAVQTLAELSSIASVLPQPPSLTPAPSLEPQGMSRALTLVATILIITGAIGALVVVVRPRASTAPRD